MAASEGTGLIRQLRETAGHLLTFCSPTNVWDSHGGLERITSILEMILTHGLSGKGDYGRFLQGLYWLRPQLVPPELRLCCMHKSGMARAWLRTSLRKHCLAEQLSFLLSSKLHLAAWYSDSSILRNDKLSKCLLICLRAIEKRKPILLSTLDSILSGPLDSRKKKSFHTVAIRRNSYPGLPEPTFPGMSHGRSHSSPDLLSIGSDHIPACRTHVRSISDSGYWMKEFSAKMSTSPSQTSLSSSLPSSYQIFGGFGDVGNKVEPTIKDNDKSQGKNLTEFLKSGNFHYYTDLEKENSHFLLAEALIAVVEQTKCRRRQLHADPDSEEEEETEQPKQRIRIRLPRHNLRKERIRNLALLSDGRTDTSPTTSQSLSPVPASSAASLSGSFSSLEDLAELSESQLTSLKESGLSLSMASLYTESDIAKLDSTAANSLETSQQLDHLHLSSKVEPSLTADGLALSLLKKFTDQHSTRTSELRWLVSDQDVPQQQLLPLPGSFPISPDGIEEEYLLTRTQLRGNLDWAPPREQFIFHVNHCPRKEPIIAKQNYRCAGCGVKVERKHVRKLRWCDYLGRLFCHCCHVNQTAVIPARILSNWEFRPYPVCRLSATFLERISSEPFWDVQAVNPTLYNSSRRLYQVRDLRQRLALLYDYILSCQRAAKLQEIFKQLPDHYTQELNRYSLSDFLKVRSGELAESLQKLVSQGVSHVYKCPFCQARGFLCEGCHGRDLLFPFQLASVARCTVCGSCFHIKCFNVKKCPKCQRIAAKKQRQQQMEEL